MRGGWLETWAIPLQQPMILRRRNRIQLGGMPPRSGFLRPCAPNGVRAVLHGFRNARTPFGAHRCGVFSLGGMAPKLGASPPPEAAIQRKIQLETTRIWVCDSFLLKVSLNWGLVLTRDLREKLVQSNVDKKLREKLSQLTPEFFHKKVQQLKEFTAQESKGPIPPPDALFPFQANNPQTSI